MLPFKFVRSPVPATSPHDVQTHPVMRANPRHTIPFDDTPIAGLSQPMTIPSRNSSRSSSSSRTQSSPLQSRSKPQGRPRHVSPAHQSDALPASVAALLAMTSIPPRKSSRKSLARPRQMSMDELMQEWKSDALASPSYGSHKTMELLLEGPRDASESSSVPDDMRTSFTTTRSSSSDSTPSLDLDDDTSVISFNSPPTPDNSNRTSRSPNGPKRVIAKSCTIVEDCALDHPLIKHSLTCTRDSVTVLAATKASSDSITPKPSFKSNLTSSLLSLKSRALSSISQLSLNNAGPNLANTPYALSDDLLWQHPYIFPRLSPEIRPVSFSGLPEVASRRYFNPTPALPPPAPLTFDEQQRHYRMALHTCSPSNSIVERRSMMIQMQTYNRNVNNKRTSSSERRAASTEAGRALADGTNSGLPLVRQREPRENSDFLRVVVLEMNMRRVGKLDETASGRARIWLPPRQQQQQQQQMLGTSSEHCAANTGERTGQTRLLRETPRRWTAIAA